MDNPKGFLEQNLAESQGKDVCRILFDGSPDAIFLADSETGIIIDANKAAAELMGRPVGEIIGLHQSRLHPPQKEAASKTIFRDHVSKGGTPHGGGPIEHQAQRADGSVVPIEITSQVITIRGRKVLQGFFRDISGRRRAEEALLESESKFKALTEMSMVGVYLIQDDLIRYVNPVMADIFGYRPEEIIDKLGPKDVVLADDWPMVRENLRKRLSGEIAAVNYGFRAVKKNGDVINVEIFGGRIDYMGRPAVIGTLLDITERQRGQEALRESEERYRTLVDNAPVGIAVYAGNKLKFLNKKLALLAGVEDTAPFIGMDVMAFVHPDSRALAAERIKALLTGRATLPPTELKTMAPNGKVFNMEVTSVLIPFQGEECIMSLFQDVTARKRAELDLQAAHARLTETNADLEKRVVERTAQLADLNKELEAFSYSAAHDMKAPLRRINIFADLLEKEAGPELNEEQHSNIRMIHKSVMHMMNLVEGLLNLSTTGRKTLEKEDVVLSELLGEVIADIRSERPERLIEWKTQALPQLKCDRAMIKQVFINLLSNAVKYTAAAEPACIEVSCSRADGEYLVCVRDNGVGFSMEYQDRIFGVFQRLHRTDEFAGTGIGLSIVKRIVARHGGRVWAESEPGKGAAFWFTLPAD